MQNEKCKMRNEGKEKILFEMKNARCKMMNKGKSRIAVLYQTDKKAQLPRGESIESLKQEAHELCNIFGKSGTTAKKLRM